MRRVLLFPLLVVISAGSLAVASPALATTSRAVTIESRVDLNTQPATGAWTATGRIADSGTLFEPVLDAVGVGSLQLHIERVFVGGQGSITIRIQSSLTGFAQGIASFTGHWVVISGTGAYADLHGEGLRTATADVNAGIVTETLTGDVHFD
jgi:hypothetical protein